MNQFRHLLELTDREQYVLGSTGEKILADRYLQKGGKLKKGALAMAVIDAEKSLHELVEVVGVSKEDGKEVVHVRLRDGHETKVPREHVDVLKEMSPRAMNARIVKGVTEHFSKEDKDRYGKRFEDELLKDFVYMPGGRINASMGTGVQTTSYNCFVIPNVGPRPSDYAISFGRTLEIQARSGGVGMNMSFVPPQGTLTEPRDVRRSDVHLVMDVWHPDILSFLGMTYPHSTKTVRLSSAFKDAMKTGGDWTFEFPDHKAVGEYDQVWNGDLDQWKSAGYPTIKADTMKARDLYAQLTDGGVTIVDEIPDWFKQVHTGDNRNQIAHALGEQWEYQLDGHQVAVNLSSLRPRYARVVGVNGRSSGAYSWATLYDKGNWAYAEGFGPVAVAEIMSTGCLLIIQGGSRRGALMIVLNDWHQDLFKFINAKRNMDLITGANISVGFSDTFMEVLEEKGDWSLGHVGADRFKEYEFKYFVQQEDFQETERVKAEDIWENMMEAAWASAEPGVIFMGRYNEMSNSYHLGYEVIATNPCGEQGIPGFSVCNLGAVNLAFMAHGWHDHLSEQVFQNEALKGQIEAELSKHFDSERAYQFLHNIKWEKLEQVTRLGLRFQDAVIDATYYPFKENETQQKGERRVGLGFMGLHDLMIYNGVRYGSEESEKFCDVVIGMMAEWCYLESVELAKQHGPFPFYKEEAFLRSGFMKQMAKEKPHVIEAIKAHGIRNVTSMTIAPTGTTGTSVGVSTGCEPYFAWEYHRNSRLGRFTEKARIVKEYRDTHPEFEVQDDFSDLPDYFVTSMDLTPEEHVMVQASLQTWIDSSISKTCNAPSDYSVEDVRALYELAYKRGAKGVTIYRYASRDTQVLETTKKEELPLPSEPAPLVVKDRKREDVLYGATYRKQTPLGLAFITINDDSEGLAREIIINIGKAGSEIFAMSETIGRLATLYLKESDNPRKESKVVKHLAGIGGQNSVGFGPNKITSIADAVAKALVEHAETFPLRFVKKEEKAAPQKASALRTASIQRDLCPNCQQLTLIQHGGCNECEACGFSKC